MERDKLSSLTNARDFFAEELKAVLEKRSIQIQGMSFEYLVSMLVHYIESDSFFTKTETGKLEENYLFKMYCEYKAGSPEVKKQVLKRLGDICLMVTGYFSESLGKKLVDVDYYFGIGGAAYWELSQTSSTSGPLFQELSVKFKTVSNVLNEMSDRAGLHNNKDVLKIYERWVHTKSDHLKEILSEQGIKSPIAFDFKTKH